jgi:FHS family L-fucose permease-like MFS transporter
MVAVLLTSFFMSLMFPTIFALGIKDLGPNTKVGGAMIIMGIVGGAVLTPLMAKFSQTTTLAHAYLIPLLCYVYIAYFALAGSRIRTRS